ncbi:hypothetical protein HU200_056758 [Digitaria exilis]|uniref:Phospholipid/glycerol acyltransferase domain-containing protein n=1 Tax=Digitaria exilis TaxID=1010633 RepID=A0A835AF20_9POAL|nr:hypothetical protein HU200_056758 [Digitaria exilis]
MALDTAAAADAPPPSGPGAGAGPLAGEELDARYAPYARRDAYGVMGRGPLAPAEAARLALAAAVLLPLRFVAGMLVLLLYYFVCRVCTLGVAADGDRPRLVGWRRKAVLRAGCALSRAMLFVFGFYWIRETHRTTTNAEAVNLDQSEGWGRPGAIVSNHVSYVDILYHMSASFPSFVAKVLSLKGSKRSLILIHQILNIFFHTCKIMQARHVFFLLCQFVNYIEVVRLPVYYPSEQEKEDPKLYANNVRKLIAMEGNLSLSNLGLADKRVYHAALSGSSVPGAGREKDD